MEDREIDIDIDVIESTPEPRRSRPAATAGLVVAFAAVAVVGYLVGARHGTTTTTAAPTRAVSTAAYPGPAVMATGMSCSQQIGDHLQLGIEITNRSTTTVTLRQIRAGLPMGGLRAAASTWSTCGELAPKPATVALPLPGGTATWLTMTFDVLDPCPAPLPVQFSVDYVQAGTPSTVDLPGFSDLGDVPYTAASCTSG